MSLPFWTLRSLLSTYVVKKISLTSTLRTMWSLIWTGLSSSLAPAIIFILGVSVHRRPTPDTQPETDRSPASRQLKNTDLGFLEALLFHWQYLWETLFSSVQFSSVIQSCLTLCDLMNCSTPGLPVHHQLPEFTETHVHWVSDAIQPSHPLSSPSPPAPNPSQHQDLSNESTLRMRWPKYWSFSFSISPSNEHPGLISFRMD